VKKTTGTQTKKAGLTWLGTAKPDDPVFKEGWTVSFQPQSEQSTGGTEKPLRFPSGREVKGINKQILEDCLRDHPTLTVEKCLEMMEALGC